jgi:nicotinamide-nucleotide amidase
MFSPRLKALASATLERLETTKRKCATAESCTGGLAAALLTSIPGSSHMVDRGFVTYSNESKIEMLGVAKDIIETHGAVSAPCAEAMAKGALERSGADVAVSITGIAGPDGGSEAKPVGLVYLAVATPAKTEVVEKRFGAQARDTIREESVVAALEMIRASA